jgi:hypothetical protein
VIVDCNNCQFELAGENIGTLELVNCKNVTLNIERRSPCITVDSCVDCSINFMTPRLVSPAIWANVENLRMGVNGEFARVPKVSELGNDEADPTFDIKTAQYSSAFDPEGKLLTEKIVREGAGYAVTESKFKRNEAIKQANEEKMMKALAASIRQQ